MYLLSSRLGDRGAYTVIYIYIEREREKFLIKNNCKLILFSRQIEVPNRVQILIS